MYSPVILEVLKKTKISARQACGSIGICEWKSPPDLSFSLNLPKFIENSIHESIVEKVEVDVEDNATDELYYFGHFTDLHMDLDYFQTAEAACGDPICCRADSHHGEETLLRGAGPFGDYCCDLPLTSVTKALRAMRDFKVKGTDGQFKQGLDFILFSGDVLPHDIWEQDVPQVNRYMDKFKALLDKEIGNLPIFSSMGNHESAPPNLFIPKAMNATAMSWLYSSYANAFSTLSPEAKLGMSKNGFYSTLIKPGLRCIALNNNVSYAFNFWLYIDIFDRDPDSQLTWLVEELYKAEVAQEKVFILGHEPPGSYDTLPQWASQYEKIVVRFSHIILGQFYGHTHHDHFQLFYNNVELSNISGFESDSDISKVTTNMSEFKADTTSQKEYKVDSKTRKSQSNSGGKYAKRENSLNSKYRIPCNIAWITPAVTTFGEMNPAFRIFGANKRTNEIQKVFTFTMDLKPYHARRSMDIAKQSAEKDPLKLDPFQSSHVGNSESCEPFDDSSSSYSRNERRQDIRNDIRTQCHDTFEEFRMLPEQPRPSSEPCFKLSYEMTQEYQMPNVSPMEVHLLVERMKMNPWIFHKFHENYYKKTTEKIPKCNDRCRKKLICQLQTAVYQFNC